MTAADEAPRDLDAAAAVALEQAQVAARAVFRAVRAALDVAEALVEDPAPLLEAVASAAAVGRAIGARATRPPEPGGAEDRQRDADETCEPDAAGAPLAARRRSGVQRVRVSKPSEEAEL